MDEKAPHGAIDIREDLAPVYIISFVGTPSDAQFDAYLNRLSRIMFRLEPRALIYDATGSAAVPASHRKKMAAWMKEHDAQVRAGIVGTAFVLPSAMMRGMLTAILWIQPMACPHLVVGTLAEAKVWSRARLNQRLGVQGQSDPLGL